MIPKFRAWSKKFKRMYEVTLIDYENGDVGLKDDHGGVAIGDIKQLILMQSTGLFDKNGVEIFEGEWEVEEQLYYVKLVDKEFGYLNQNIDDLRLTVSNKNQTSDWKSKFTRAEVKAIDPRYSEFLEEVE
ncbi:YopX family protein [Streptococcus agalactiae]